MNAPDFNGFAFDWTFPLAFFWGLLVLAAFLGWGQIISGWLLPSDQEKDVGWGLEAAWGMATFLVLSGPMLMLSLFGRPFLLLFLLTGLIRAACHLFLCGKNFLGPGPTNLYLQKVRIFLLCLIAVIYTGAVAIHEYNPSDDFEAYFSHTKMALDTGTYRDPFDFRLFGSMEGQQTLSALIVGFLPWKYAHVLDMGIAELIVLGLMHGMVRGDSNRARIARLTLVALVLTFPMPRFNTASELTGVVLFLALFYTFDLLSKFRSVKVKSVLLLAGVAVATATLRCHNVFFVALLGLAYICWRLWDNEKNRSSIIHEAMLLLGFSVILLLPWCVVAYRSDGSFLFPLIKGTLRPEFETFNLHLPFLATISFIGGYFISTVYLLLFFPVCLVNRSRARQLFSIFGAAILLLSIMFLSQYIYGAFSDLNRYLFPIGLAFGCYTSGLLARQEIVTPFRLRNPIEKARASFVIFSVVAVLFFQSFYFWDAWSQDILLIRWATNASYPLRAGGMFVSIREPEREYQEACSRIPMGSNVLAALDYPFLLDYRNHNFFSLDIAGAASPDPGLPYFQGPEKVKEYLLSHGIRYIVHVPFDRATYFYSRTLALYNLNGPVTMYRSYAKYSLDIYDNLDQLEKNNRILYDSPCIRVVDLGGS